jgi:hypothetical protein
MVSKWNRGFSGLNGKKNQAGDFTIFTTGKNSPF